MKTCPVCDTPYPDQQHKGPTDGAVLVESREFAPGQLVRGKYRIVRKLGQGGMGEVYLAEHLMLGGQLALKFLAAELSRNPQFIKRFRQEARAAYQLRHPNIVEAADLDQDDDGTLFIAMEYVHGSSLRTVMSRTTGPLATERVLHIARSVAAGLAAAHARGIVHRDVKPDNILLGHVDGAGDAVKILDFGIAAMTEGITNISRTHGLLLTPEYAAPEQWRGTPAAKLDGRTDLYALGGVLFEMLTARTPFRSETTEGWMYQHLEGTPASLAELRPDLARNYPRLPGLVNRLLARDREGRPASAVEFLRELKEVQRPAAQAAAGRETVVETPGERKTAPVERKPTVVEEDDFSDVEKRLVPVISAEDKGGEIKKKRKRRGLAGFILLAAVIPVVAAFFYWASKTPSPTDTSAQPAPAEQTAAAPGQPAETQPAAQPEVSNGPTWTDPATSLMWAGSDNGKDVTLAQAKSYCENLHRGGYADWRLPRFDELSGIYDPNIRNDKHNEIKGGIQLSSWWIRSSTPADKPGEAWTVNFGVGYKQSDKIDSADNERALCVRHI